MFKPLVEFEKIFSREEKNFCVCDGERSDKISWSVRRFQEKKVGANPSAAPHGTPPLLLLCFLGEDNVHREIG